MEEAAPVVMVSLTGIVAVIKPPERLGTFAVMVQL
jgi:hypothetical protein